jgi:hypothetical protein
MTLYSYDPRCKDMEGPGQAGWLESTIQAELAKEKR